MCISWWIAWWFKWETRRIWCKGFLLNSQRNRVKKLSILSNKTTSFHSKWCKVWFKKRSLPKIKFNTYTTSRWVKISDHKTQFSGIISSLTLIWTIKIQRRLQVSTRITRLLIKPLCLSKFWLKPTLSSVTSNQICKHRNSRSRSSSLNRWILWWQGQIPHSRSFSIKINSIHIK